MQFIWTSNILEVVWTLLIFVQGKSFLDAVILKSRVAGDFICTGIKNGIVDLALQNMSV